MHEGKQEKSTQGNQEAVNSSRDDISVNRFYDNEVIVTFYYIIWLHHRVRN